MQRSSLFILGLYSFALNLQRTSSVVLPKLYLTAFAQSYDYCSWSSSGLRSTWSGKTYSIYWQVYITCSFSFYTGVLSSWLCGSVSKQASPAEWPSGMAQRNGQGASFPQMRYVTIHPVSSSSASFLARRKL